MTYSIKAQQEAQFIVENAKLFNAERVKASKALLKAARKERHESSLNTIMRRVSAGKAR